MNRSMLPERGTVDHHRSVGEVVISGIVQAEPLGEHVVELDSPELPLSTDAIPDDEIGLRAIESGLSGGFVVRQLHLVEHRADVGLGFLPGLAGRALVLGVVGVAPGETEPIIGQAQTPEDELGQLHRVAKFLADLVRGAEQVGIVLGEASNTSQARELARLLVAIDGAKLGQADGEVAIAPRLRGEDLDVVCGQFIGLRRYSSLTPSSST